MPQPHSPFAYPDVEGLLNRALESEKGIRAPCADHGAAVQLRHRVNGYRAALKRENKKVYPIEHPMHGRTPYDAISLRLGKGDEDHYVYLINLTGVELPVEEL